MRGVKECETVISKSREEADEMLVAIRLSAQEQANEKLEQAELKAKQLMQESCKGAEEEILVLKDRVKGKEEKAISLVFSNII